MLSAPVGTPVWARWSTSCPAPGGWPSTPPPPPGGSPPSEPPPPQPGSSSHGGSGQLGGGSGQGCWSQVGGGGQGPEVGTSDDVGSLLVGSEVLVDVGGSEDDVGG
ncbi:hypothetical protein ABT324_30460 [Saccharopolyspora sp. NPDC000359]|uniref:hypothetical protein n=1 Tax=Saccharopolyspora sp. NPDC000359 TaxID=3154251 RepID=UPI00331FE4F5